MSRHTELIDAVNDAKTESDFSRADNLQVSGIAPRTSNAGQSAPKVNPLYIIHRILKMG